MARQKAWRRKDLIDLLSKVEIEDAERFYNAARDRLDFSRNPPRELRVLAVAFRIHLDFIQNIHLLALLSTAPDEKVDHRSAGSVTALSYLYNDGAAMLLMCLHGLDVQARTLLKTYLERLDLIITILTHSQVASEYVTESSLEESMKFFYRRTSKGRLGNSALAGFSNVVPELADFADWLWKDFRVELGKIVGAAAHSNHTVGLISLFPNLHSGRSSALGLDGFPNNGSLKTLGDALICSLPLAALHNHAPLFEPSKFFAREMPEEIAQAQAAAKDGARFGMIFPVADSILREHGRARSL
jgi:hypothetical protein